MIVNPIMQPATGDSVYWLTCDTKERYQTNVSSDYNKQRLQDNGWLDTQIEYKFNSESFRSIEFVSDEPAIAVFGCSFTQGIGLRYHQIWHQKLGKKLNRPVFNFGVGGCSLDTCYRIAEHYLPTLNVDTVILLATSEYRMEFWSPTDIMPWFMNISTTRDNIDLGFFTKWCLDPRNTTMHANKNIQAIAYLCTMLGMEFYTYDSTILEGLNTSGSLARDLAHHGESAHAALAEIMSTDMSNKNVYRPHWLNRAQPPGA